MLSPQEDELKPFGSSENVSVNSQLLKDGEEPEGGQVAEKKMKRLVKKFMQRKRATSATWDLMVADVNMVTQQNQRSKEEETRLSKIRKQASKILESDDVEALLRLIQEENDSAQGDESKEVLSLESPSLSEPKKNMTLLHAAMEEARPRISAYMVDRCSGEYLTRTYTNMDRQSPASRKSCLHILAEHGDLELTHRFLSRLRKRFPSVPAVTHSVFLLAASESNENQVQKFVNETVVTKVPNGKTRMNAAHLAAINGHHRLFDLLADCEVDLDAKDSNDETPLMWAIKSGGQGAFAELLKLGVDVNRVDKFKSSALHLAIIVGQTDMAEVLIDHPKIDLNLERIKKPRWVAEIVAEQNHLQLMRKLMQPETRKKVAPASITGALFLASRQGFVDVVEEILSNFEKMSNFEDGDYNTPVMAATENGRLPVVRLLVEKYKVDLTKRNKFKETVYDLAMRLDSICLLKYLMDNSDCKLKPTYLHSAAASGNTEKIDFIMSVGLPLLETDANDNTIFHTAAANNANQVLTYYLHRDDDLTDLQNKNGDTPLHIAARKGHVDCVRTLLSMNARVDATNKQNQNALHLAVSTTSAGVEIVSLLVDRMRETHESLLNEQDSEGNTALHLAALYRREELLEHLRDVDSEIENVQGDRALRTAVVYATLGEVKAILKLFYASRKRNVDKRDKDGKTALMNSIESGDSRKTELLLQYGADLSVRTSSQSTCMHQLIAGSARNPASTRKFLETYYAIVRDCVRWYCEKNDHKCPTRGTSEHLAYRAKAVVHLTSELYCDKYNALQYASKLGNRSLLLAMLHTRDAYKFTYSSKFKLPLVKQYVPTAEDSYRVILAGFLENKLRESKSVLYDVTHLIPRTEPRRLEAPITLEVDALEGSRPAEGKNQRTSRSCLELIVNTNDESFINHVLDGEPFKFLVSRYWTLCRRAYEVLMWLHVAYMIFFTYFTLPTSDFLHSRFHILNETAEADIASDGGGGGASSISGCGLFLVWPLFILLCEVAMLVYFVSSAGETNEISPFGSFDRRNIGDITSGLMRIPVGAMLFIFDNLSHISSLAFGLASITWFAMIVHSSNPHAYLESLSVVLIFGWLHTTNYVKGFKDWNSLATILKEILIKDITRFVYIYIFVLISFGYAIHALIQADYHLKPDEKYPTTTIYLTFYKMLSPENFLDGLDEKDFDESGGNVGFLRAISAAYSVLSTVVLMNLLIAMMNNTYTEVQSSKSTAWKIESLRMTLWFERLIPCFGAWNLLGIPTKYDHNQKRFYLEKTLTSSAEESTDEDRRRKMEAEEEEEEESKKNDSKGSDDTFPTPPDGRKIKVDCRCHDDAILTRVEKIGWQIDALRDELAAMKMNMSLMKSSDGAASGRE